MKPVQQVNNLYIICHQSDRYDIDQVIKHTWFIYTYRLVFKIHLNTNYFITPSENFKYFLSIF